MAPPWKTATKIVSVSGHDPLPHPGASSSFSAPQPLQHVSFKPTDLFASAARLQAHSGASLSFIAALQAGVAAVTEALVDDLGSAFSLSTDIQSLTDFERAGFAGRIGAGICDLYMLQSGYVWRDLASRVISTKPLGDFIYEGVPTRGLGVVLTEAKGSFRQGLRQRDIERETLDGFTRQVHPHIGTQTTVGPVLHGYAIGFGTEPGGIGPFLHICESTPTVASPVHGSTSLNPPGPAVGPSNLVALGNYRAAFHLMGAEQVVHFIDAIQDKVPLLKPREQFFSVVRSNGGWYLTTHFSAQRWREFPGGGIWAVEKELGREVLRRLEQLARHEISTSADRMRLDTVPLRLSGETDNTFVQFPDGLALLRQFTEEMTMRWMPSG